MLESRLVIIICIFLFRSIVLLLLIELILRISWESFVERMGLELKLFIINNNYFKVW